MTQLEACMSSEEFGTRRAAIGLRRAAFCAAVGISPATVYNYERGKTRIPDIVAQKVRLLEAPPANPLRISIATFGDKFVVIRLSRIEAAELWQVDVLPMVHDTRQSAIIAGGDYARLHGCVFVGLGF